MHRAGVAANSTSSHLLQSQNQSNGPTLPNDVLFLVKNGSDAYPV